MKEKMDAKKILRDVGLKNTIPRLTILQVLSEIQHPETARELYKRIKKAGVDLVTLYRTLASFEKKGILRKIDLHKEAIYYELSVNHHHHIFCTNCDKVENFENLEVEKVLEEIARKSSKFKSIQEHSFELFGLCRECA